MYRVINAFVLKRTGHRIEPGEMFEPESELQAARLLAAGCLDPTPVLTTTTQDNDEPMTADEPRTEDRPTRRGRRRNHGD